MSVLQKKEFQILNYKTGPKLDIDELQISTQQLFTARWMNLNDVKRCVLKHSTGSGKTIGSVFTAAQNLKLYKLLGKGRIIIIGFQKNTFINEIMDKPELGFISRSERDYLRYLYTNATTEMGREKYQKTLMQIRSRIFSDNYIIFFGYQELYNALFEFYTPTSQEPAKEHNSKEQEPASSQNIAPLQDFAKKNERKILRANPEIIEMFENAFVICDEIHNVYNSQETNTYGQAIKHILDYYVGKETEPKVLFMSATPLNYRPSELVDLLNLIIPKSKFEKKDFFSIKKTAEGELDLLLPGALKKIKEICSGYFSFYINEDASLMPRKKFVGTKIKTMYFTECSLKAQDDLLKLNKISFEDRNLYDAVFPCPKDFSESNSVFIWKTSDFRRLYQTEPDWCHKHGFRFSDGTFTGTAFQKENIQNYSDKYYKMLEHLEKSEGKVLIYHEFINGTGVKMIEQILLVNGYISINAIPNENTICLCGKKMSEHKNILNEPKVEDLVMDELDIIDEFIKPSEEKTAGDEIHKFTAKRYILLHGEIDKKTISTHLKLFNSDNNARGEIAKIAIGSEMIREGVNFKAVRNIYVMHLLPHISAYIQLIGRAVRTMSHTALPVEEQEVIIKTFSVAAEITRYTQKIENYKVIQEIDRVIHENAVDVSFYYDTIKASFSEDVLGILPYSLTSLTPQTSLRSSKNSQTMQLDTYNVFYKAWEIEEIKKYIMALFVSRPAWTFNDLWAAVRDPPFMRYIDTTKFELNNFKMALGDMIYGIKPAVIYRKSIPHKIRAVTNKIIYYVCYPTLEQKTTSLGQKIENLDGAATMDNLSWVQSYQPKIFLKYDITNDLGNLNQNYDDMKRNIFQKFGTSNITKMPLSTEFYSKDFHQRFIEESIMYVFQKFIGMNIHSEYQEFYFKMLHFYWQLGIILYADGLPPKYAKLYDEYCSGEINTNRVLQENAKYETTSALSFDPKYIEELLEQKKTKIPRNVLPVGHLISKNPRIYLEHGWMEIKDFNEKVEQQIENNIIVGYYEKSHDVLGFNFKLRKPVHKIEQVSDKRVMEKGMVCETKTKSSLEKIAKELGILSSGTNIFLCASIKEYLLYMELKDRKLFSTGKVPIRTRWCYLQYECEY